MKNQDKISREEYLRVRKEIQRCIPQAVNKGYTLRRDVFGFIVGPAGELSKLTIHNGSSKVCCALGSLVCSGAYTSADMGEEYLRRDEEIALARILGVPQNFVNGFISGFDSVYLCNPLNRTDSYRQGMVMGCAFARAYKVGK